MKRFAVLLIILLFSISSCTGSVTSPGTDTVNDTTDPYLEGLTFMSQFNPSRARTQFLTAVNQSPDNCKAYIGLALADFQYVIFNLNDFAKMLLGLVQQQSSPQFSPSDDTTFEGYDFNKLLANLLYSIDTYITEMDSAANKVEELAIKQGWESCVLDTRENPVAASDEQYKYYPLWIGGNDKEPANDIYPPIELRLGPLFDEAEIRTFTFYTTLLQGILYFIVAHDLTFTLDLTRFARVLSPFSESISQLGANIASMLGIDTGACIIPFSDGTSIQFNQGYSYIVTTPTTNPLSPVPGFTYNLPTTISDYPENARLLSEITPDNCSYVLTWGTEGSISSLYSVLRNLAFFFDQNPKFLAKNISEDDDRWDKFFPRVDNVLGESFSQISGLFDALVRRAIGIDKSSRYTEADLNNFLIYVKDQDPMDVLGNGDTLGISLGDSPEDRIFIHIYDDPAENDKLKNTIITAINFLRISTTDEQIQALEKLFTDLRDNFLAVDNPGLEYEPFNLTDLNVLLDMTIVLRGRIPDVIKIDIPKYFINPKPLRDYFPYWYKYTDPTFIYAHDFPVSFLIETEWTNLTEDSPGLPTYGSLGLLQLNGLSSLLQQYANNLYQINPSIIYYSDTETYGVRLQKYMNLINSTNPLLTFLKNDHKIGWNLKDYDFIKDHSHFGGTYEIAGPVDGTPEPIPEDCLDPDTLPKMSFSVGSFSFSIPSEVMPYIAFPDPSFNGALLINIKGFYPYYQQYIACGNDPDGYITANNYAINKIIPLMIYVFMDKDQIGLGNILSLIGGGGG